MIPRSMRLQSRRDVDEYPVCKCLAAKLMNLGEWCDHQLHQAALSGSGRNSEVLCRRGWQAVPLVGGISRNDLRMTGLDDLRVKSRDRPTTVVLVLEWLFGDWRIGG